MRRGYRDFAIVGVGESGESCVRAQALRLSRRAQVSSAVPPTRCRFPGSALSRREGSSCVASRPRQSCVDKKENDRSRAGDGDCGDIGAPRQSELDASWLGLCQWPTKLGVCGDATGAAAVFCRATTRALRHIGVDGWAPGRCVDRPRTNLEAGPKPKSQQRGYREPDCSPVGRAGDQSPKNSAYDSASQQPRESSYDPLERRWP